jgi:NitT/TauT family transport system ATP-binding protein
VLQAELSRLVSTLNLTVVFITHSVEEAVLLGDRVVSMTARPGRIQADVAIDLPRPRDPTSAAFNAYRRQIDHLLAEASGAAFAEQARGGDR